MWPPSGNVITWVRLSAHLLEIRKFVNETSAILFKCSIILRVAFKCNDLYTECDALYLRCNFINQGAVWNVLLRAKSNSFLSVSPSHPSLRCCDDPLSKYSRSCLSFISFKSFLTTCAQWCNITSGLTCGWKSSRVYICLTWAPATSCRCHTVYKRKKWILSVSDFQFLSLMVGSIYFFFTFQGEWNLLFKTSTVYKTKPDTYLPSKAFRCIFCLVTVDLLTRGDSCKSRHILNKIQMWIFLIPLWMLWGYLCEKWECCRIQ